MKHMPTGTSRCGMLYVRCAALWVGLISAGCGSPGGPEAVPTVIALGDSHSYPEGVQPTDSWPQRLAESLQAQLELLAFPGQSSTDIRRTQVPLALDSLSNPALKIVAITFNAQPVGRDLATFESDVDASLAELETALRTYAPSAPLLVMTVPSPTPLVDADHILRAQAKRHGAGLIDAAAHLRDRGRLFVSTDRRYGSDDSGTVLNDEGQALLADVATNSYGLASGSDADGDGASDLTEGVLGTSSFDVDTDQDGCSDGEELGSNEALGGRRDPLNFWDFFDTPNESGQRNGSIDLFGDIFNTAFRFGGFWDPPMSEAEALAQALGVPPPAPAYHTGFDRGPPASSGADPWDLTAPDGSIDLFNDIMGVAFQFGHSCQGAGPPPACPNPDLPIVELDIASFSVTPPNISVPVGSTLRWTNHDAVIHTIMEGAPGALVSEWAVGPILPGETASRDFCQTKSIQYHCHEHAAIMQGYTIEVSP